MIARDTRVLLGEPARHPTELVEALKRLFGRRKDVKRAWVAHFHNPETGEPPHTLLALEVDGDWNAVSREIGIVVQSVPLPDPPVDVMQITGRSDGVEDYFKTVAPFYARKRFGLF
jgi:hypothetical protein